MKKSLLSAFVFFGTLIVLSVAYAAYQTISSSEYASGAAVSSALMGKIVGNIDILNTRLTSAETTIASQATTIASMNTTISTLAPTGAVVAFNLSSCPTGWSLADGASGRPDLRGEFIRGLDNGRGVDSGRTIGSSQSQQTLIRMSPDGSIVSGNIQLSGAGNTYRFENNGPYGGVNSSTTSETRPRNVALLYCIKN
ncbi:MAG: hypothetical protein PHH16_04405 [Candidatus Gracilibacteria bacterium]|nr:hypothetical protein [Candidatus Gracilibacteria bacterium]